jgi:hypothetical protein
MSVHKHVKTLAGLPVAKFRRKADAPAQPATVAWRVAGKSDEPKSFTRRLDALVEAPWAGEIRALVIGDWGASYENPPPLDALVAAADRLTNLRALFIGDITPEECEISWINVDDVTPLLAAYPGLEVLRVRGGEEPEIQPLRHNALRELAFETGGLPAEVVRAVGESDLPELRHLELWLGTDNYGGDANVADLAGVLSGARLPKLEYLGLRDAEIADLVAGALAGAPVVGRLTALDLSLGMLSDVGAAALLSGQPLTHLRRLDLHHHFLSVEMMARLRDEFGPAEVALDLSKAKGADTDAEDRYIAVSE